MDLAVERADVEPILIAGVNGHDADIAAVRSDYRPIAELSGITKNISVGKGPEW